MIKAYPDRQLWSGLISFDQSWWKTFSSRENLFFTCFKFYSWHFSDNHKYNFSKHWNILIIKLIFDVWCFIFNKVNLVCTYKNTIFGNIFSENIRWQFYQEYWRESPRNEAGACLCACACNTLRSWFSPTHHNKYMIMR